MRKLNNIITPANSETVSSQASESKIIEAHQSTKGTLPAEFKHHASHT